jgi:hypothetical protein
MQKKGWPAKLKRITAGLIESLGENGLAKLGVKTATDATVTAAGSVIEAEVRHVLFGDKVDLARSALTGLGLGSLGSLANTGMRALGTRDPMDALLAAGASPGRANKLASIIESGGVSKVMSRKTAVTAAVIAGTIDDSDPILAAAEKAIDHAVGLPEAGGPSGSGSNNDTSSSSGASGVPSNGDAGSAKVGPGSNRNY